MHSSSNSGKLCIISSYWASNPNRRRSRVISYQAPISQLVLSMGSGLQRNQHSYKVTYVNYHCSTDQGTFTSKSSLGTAPTLRNTTSTNASIDQSTQYEL